MDLVTEERVVLRRRDSAEEIPKVGVDGISYRTVIVIQIGKDDQSDRKTVRGKQIPCSLRLGNGEELIVIPDINCDWNFPYCFVDDPIKIRSDHGGKHPSGSEIL